MVGKEVKLLFFFFLKKSICLKMNLTDGCKKKEKKCELAWSPLVVSYKTKLHVSCYPKPYGGISIARGLFVLVVLSEASG